MKPIFLFLCAVSVATMLYTFSLGWRRHYGLAAIEERLAAGQQVSLIEIETYSNLIGPHFVWAILAGISVCLTHSVVLTYFLGTGKAIQEQTELQNWSEEYNEARRKLMGKAVIPAVTGILCIAIAAFAGGFALIRTISPEVHLVISSLGVLAQFPVFARELAIIHENGKLMDKIIERLGGDNIRIAL